MGLKSRKQGGSHYRQLKLTAKEKIQQILFGFQGLKLTAKEKIQHILFYYRLRSSVFGLSSIAYRP
jgi:hypothetical protein